MQAMLEAALLSSAESSLNLLLKHNTPALAQVKSLAGKSIHITLTSPPYAFFVLMHEQGIDLLHHSETPPDLTLTGTAADLFIMAQSEQSQGKLFGQGIELEGDLNLAQSLKALLRDFSIDWEAWLAEWLGDTLAHPVAEAFTAQSRYLKHSAASFALNTKEFLQEESRVLPPPAEVEGFTCEVEALRDDVARLEARIQRLLARTT
ncbi:ubiquinone biosynthesis accessory factor UbiJ [Nitrincola alkalisediminis]|uniref:ubiquinone biosynthesis accessory factor UbiJ n=1 Tax=Nitrincola alkalisediminis TaxID=1366656 RepID=UPI001873FAAA|nr:SCP2 sterol-binding domain-containing protein [Nitrincola alkalisediminis]